MPRPPRLERPGLNYYITVRGNARLPIFFNDVDRLHFIDSLSESIKVFHIRLFAGVLLTDHFHLLLQIHQPNLSRFMQRLLTSYAVYVRYHHDRPGHLFQSRFQAQVAQGGDTLLRLARHIHLNPLRVASKDNQAFEEQVHFLDHYQWSTWPFWVGLRPVPDYLDLDLLSHLGDNRRETLRSYRNFTFKCITAEDPELKQFRSLSSHAIGNREFVKSIEQELMDLRTGKATDYDIDLPHRIIPIDDLLSEAAAAFHITSEQLKEQKGHTGLAWGGILEVICRTSGLNQRQVGEYFGVTSWTINKARKRFREESAEGNRQLVNEVVQNLIQSHMIRNSGRRNE